ncbi:glycogen synthase GlgA [Hydrogenimonas sp.]
MKLLFAAAEAFPFVKTGGLADMAHALPKALVKEGVAVETLLPLYRFVDRARFGIEPLGEGLTLEFGGKRFEVALFGCRYEGVRHTFLYEPTLCERDHPYGLGGDYPDNDLRFAIFCHAIAALATRRNADLVHLNDWHTALAALLMRDQGVAARSLFTIHNLAYQGLFEAATLKRCGIAPTHFTMEELEFYGRVNWMKGGIAYADRVTTVSPTYAQEIQTPEFGCGLEGFLRKHAAKLTGILNGIDTDLFDPAADAALPARYRVGAMGGKGRCKAAYLEEAGLKHSGWPLFIFIGRFVEQKGVDWLVEAAPKLAKMPMNLAILGEGEARWHGLLEAAAGCYDNIHLTFGYDEGLSHRMYAAADFLLMPSRFEPCGLNQMIAMRYGALPVAHSVGGLRDTVHETEARCGRGILFDTPDVSALLAAVERALSLYEKRRRYAAWRRFNMACDFSIAQTAKRYADLYRELA